MQQKLEEAEAAARSCFRKSRSLAKARQKQKKPAEAEYKAIAAEVKADAAKGPDHTFKRQGEEIFRREMGEPEFFLDKKDRFPRPILSAENKKYHKKSRNSTRSNS